MTEIKVGENESIDMALKRFKRLCQRDGIISDIRKHEFYEKPSEKKKKKLAAARRRENTRRLLEMGG
jgi:small subunit ribosomal protein S21